jgi:anti-sigma factor RsiW
MSTTPAHLSYELLSRLVERRLPAIDDARAQRHLSTCGRCRSELAWLERIGGPRGGFDDLFDPSSSLVAILRPQWPRVAGP